MPTINEIFDKINQIIQSINTAFAYKGQCSSIAKVLSEIQEKISKNQSIQSNNTELAALLGQLNLLNETIIGFSPDEWNKAILITPISEQISILTETMSSIAQLLQKLNITLENNYTIVKTALANDLKSLYGFISDPSQLENPTVKSKLEEIENYLIQIGCPLDPNSQTIPSHSNPKHQLPKKGDEQSPSENLDTTNTQNKKELNNFNNIQAYKIKLSDFTKIGKAVAHTERYTIYNGQNEETKEEVTILILDKDTNSEDKFQRLVNVLTAVHHPNLESFVGVDDTEYAVVTRRNGKKLRDFFKTIKKDSKSSDDKSTEKRNSIAPGYKTIIAYKIAEAMAYLHSLDITHRDLYSVNILIDSQFNPKITNFTNSRFLPDNVYTMSSRPISTSKFRAPELTSGDKYDREVDVFSFSSILYELLTEKIPFEGQPLAKIDKMIADKERPILPDDISSDLRDLIENCWKQNPSERPLFSEIIDTMLTKRITFPDDKDSPVVENFYNSKMIKNDDLNKSLELILDINNIIQHTVNLRGVYMFECVRVRSLLCGYYYLLQTSVYAQEDTVESLDNLVQLSSMRDYLNDLKKTVLYTDPEKWKTVAVSTPVAEIATDIYRNMEYIYIALKELGLPVTKYEYVKYDLINDFREVYYVFKDAEYQDKMDEVVSFLNQNGLQIDVTDDEVNENKQNLLMQFKDYNLNRSDFKLVKKIGSGKTSIVYEVAKKSTGEIFACKELTDDYFSESDLSINYIRREICFISNLKHKYLVNFIGFNSDVGKPLWIIIEYVDGGDLYDAVRNKEKPLTPFQKTKIAFEIAQGMDYLHSKNIIHRDLKTLNILIDKNDYTPKIADFGYSKANISLTNTVGIGTTNYMAPEMITDDDYGFQVDVFSYGMILWEMYDGRYPYQWLKSANVQIAILKDKELPFKKAISDDLKELIIKCKSHNSSNRPSFKDILQIMIDKKIAFDGADPVEIAEFYARKVEEIEQNEQNEVENNQILFESYRQ